MTDIAIVGGGFSGVLQAIQLLRQTDATVTLIERGPRLARGVAYGTRHAEHLLNVRASAMSAFPDALEHFVSWLAKEDIGGPASFAERRQYGRYVESLLAAARAEAGARLRVVEAEAIDVVRSDGAETVRMADDGSTSAKRVILSIGNLAPEIPRGIDPAALGDVYIADPWASEFTAGLKKSDIVVLVGTGLTAIDAALMLDASGFTGRAVAISRRGLVPRAHAEPAPVPALGETPHPECGLLLRAIRERSSKIGWRAAIDQLRPHTQQLWFSASIEERRRFLRHLRPYWDVHRHRIAPQIADRLALMVREGRLSFSAGKLLGASGNTLDWRPRGSDTAQQLRVARVVNCTGPQGDIARAREPLLANLLKAGRIRPDPCRIGIDVDGCNRTLDGEGKSSASLYAIGPMTRGAFWEVVAVPDIRVQVAALASHLAR